jgi:Cd2+/Zn2+-exporting ATPase
MQSEIIHENTKKGGQKSGWKMPAFSTWLDSDQAEIIFTIITFLGMVLGYIFDRNGVATPATISYIAAYVAGGYFGLQAGLSSLRERRIDVDLLMILAAMGAAIVGAPFEGAMLLFLFSLSNVLQNYALDRTKNAISSLLKLRPNEAIIKKGDQLVTLPLAQIKVGDRMVIRPGDRLPLDGKVREGSSNLDQSAITGESMPVPKQVGDTVLAGTINQQGGLEVEVTRLAKDSTLAKLIEMVEKAQSEKAETQRFIDTAEQYYAVGVIAMTALAIVIPLLFLGEAFQPAFYRAMTLMVAASPCALVISTPATVLSAIANGARRGILFKGGAYVEEAANIKVVAFDKTGTLTEGKPRVTDVHSFAMANEELVLQLAAAVEAKSEHPLAQAIVQAAEGRGIAMPLATAFQSQTGKGVQAQVEGVTIFVGSRNMFADQHWAEVDSVMTGLWNAGKTAVIVAKQIRNNPVEPIGIIAIADVLRASANGVIRHLKANGVERVVMLTGDKKEVADTIGRQVGVDEVYAELMPAQKLEILKKISQQYGKVAMVGDGVNDAPALAAADIGIAMGAAGTDVALETADVVLMADDLTQLPYMFQLSRQTRRVLVQNLVFAIVVIFILIGSVLGFGLALPLSVIGHEGSTVLVSLNGLRMLGFKGTAVAA